MRVKGKVAVVTGAGSDGIGRAVCLRLAEEGAAVAVWDIRGDGAEETAERIRRSGGKAHAFTVDVSRSEEVRRAAEGTVETFGGVDILVNNAGIMHNRTVETEDEAGWDRILGVNVKGVFLCSKYIVPHMRRRGKGAIVNTGSVTGIMGYPNLAAYCASKGAVHSLTRAMAMDYAAENIRVNAVAPGTVDTPILHDFLKGTPDPKKARAAFDAIHPIGRVATPRDVADAVLYLVSDESSFVTGHVLVVDGGFTVRGVQPTG